MTVRNYTELIVWQKAMALAEAVYQATESFPKEERYGLVAQMRRAAVSIPSNIAEGEGRGEDGNMLHSLRISYGSLRELETQMLLANRLRMLSDADSPPIFDQCDEVGRVLNGLMKTVRKRIETKRRRTDG